MDRATLHQLYLQNGASMQEIATLNNCSLNKVVYWMKKYDIKRRSISEAIYAQHNPNGDPFTVKPITTREQAKLLGIGIGLYWGEGTKANKWSVRLGNTDPALLRTFITFLVKIFEVKQADMRFALQIFSDINPHEALEYWVHELGVMPSQFGRPTVTISGSIGTYRKKSSYGVVTVSYHNKKLRDILVSMLPP